MREIEIVRMAPKIHLHPGTERVVSARPTDPRTLAQNTVRLLREVLEIDGGGHRAISSKDHSAFQLAECDDEYSAHHSTVSTCAGRARACSLRRRLPSSSCAGARRR